MKKMKYIFGLGFLFALAVSCNTPEGVDGDLSSLNSPTTANFNKIFEVSDNNSGTVKISPTGDGFSTYTIQFGDGESTTINNGSVATHHYPEGSYTVTITSYDLAGHGTTTSYPLDIVYRAPENLIVSIGSDMKLTATALYANGFLVNYGDGSGDVSMTTTVNAASLGTGLLPAHIYPAGGPYVLTVTAQSGGAATTVYTKTLFGFPIDYENANVDYFFGTFGSVNFTKVANPNPSGINTSAMVGKYEKPNGVPNWSGTYSPLNIPINFAQGNKVKIMVYNTDPANIGKKLNVELEAAVSGTGATPNGVGVLKTAITTVNAWEELVFDFSTIPAIPSTARFGQLVFRFNDSASGAGETIYVDNIRITN